MAAARALDDRGLNQGRSGNVSLRVEDGFLVTPSGVPPRDLTEESVAHLDLEGSYAGPLAPSSEWRMHLALYRNRPELGAMVHAHPTFATALACLRRDIPPFHYMVAMAGGTTIRCAPYATFGTVALSASLLAGLHERRACLLANHGLVATGAALSDALELATVVESLARQYCQALAIGEPVLLSDQQMQEVLARFAAYGKPDSGAGNDVLGFPPRRA